MNFSQNVGARWMSRLSFIVIFLIGLPAIIWWFHDSRAAELRSLAANGIEIDAMVTRVGGSRVRVAYVVNGVSYEAEAPLKKTNPTAAGAQIRIRYLPERPKVVWVGNPPTGDDIAHALVGAKIMFVATIVLGGFLLLMSFVARRPTFGAELTELSLRVPADALRRSLTLATTMVWLIITGIIVAINLIDPGIRAVHEKAFGSRPLGLLQGTVVAAVYVIACLPLLAIIRQLQKLMLRTGSQISVVFRGAKGDKVTVIDSAVLTPSRSPSDQTAIERPLTWMLALVLGELALWVAFLAVAWNAYVAFQGIKMPLS